MEPVYGERCACYWERDVARSATTVAAVATTAVAAAAVAAVAAVAAIAATTAAAARVGMHTIVHTVVHSMARGVGGDGEHDGWRAWLELGCGGRAWLGWG